MKRLILLRPEPGLSASRARAEALGLEVIPVPLFTVEPLAADMPSGSFDALVLTSANAVRYAGSLLDRVSGLPAYAVGEATAEALCEAGIEPVAIGSGGVEGLDLPPGRLLHLAGEAHRPLPGDVTVAPVYRSVALDVALPSLAGTVIAVHSPRAGARLSELSPDGRGEAVIAAISPAAGDAAGEGWQAVRAAPSPDDKALLALAAALCQSATP